MTTSSEDTDDEWKLEVPVVSNGRLCSSSEPARRSAYRSVFTFLKLEVLDWYLDQSLANEQLSNLGRRSFRLTHRASHFHGEMRLLHVSPHQQQFYHDAREEWITVARYFLLEYHVVIPKCATSVAYFEFDPTALFPLEVIQVA